MCIQMAMNSIAHYRKMRGLTQAQLGELVGVEQPHISRIEKGDEGPPLALFRRLADALKVSLPDLLSPGRDQTELHLLQIFRRLPPERKAGWLDMAKVAAADLPEQDQETDQTVGRS
jgi:transcriptional regulator with XRE-family HTH domain